ncbi:MAG: trehalase family glycosidase, partial [Woeseiaceae bacterium]
MVRNFAYLIDTIGFVPNGNRTYFCTRSQPPYFVLMVELLAGLRGDGVWDEYLPRLEREYAYWMDGADTLTNSRDATRRVVKVDDGFLNRYWDDSDRPRQESFAEDREHTAHAERDACEYYRSIRAACESGWDFSSRWLGDADDLVSIRTTSILPVDLNALLYRLESRLARCHSNENPTLASEYEARAAGRLRQLQTRFYDERQGFFFDLQMTDMQSTGVKSLAAAYPLFLGIATPEQAENVVRLVHEQFLAAGGWLTTLYRSGQQWDRPNGWAPLQWLTFDGFCRYGFESEAREGATRWVRDNIDVYERTGRLFEKYDVERIDALATGGEYAVQDGFGWTNGVLLKLMNRLDI